MEPLWPRRDASVLFSVLLIKYIDKRNLREKLTYETPTSRLYCSMEESQDMISEADLIAILHSMSYGQ